MLQNLTASGFWTTLNTTSRRDVISELILIFISIGII